MNKRVIILLSVLYGSTQALNFRPINYLPVGSRGEYGFFCFYDSNHDSVVDLHFQGSRHAGGANYFYTYSPWNRLILLDSVPIITLCYFWAVGDFDGDSLADLVMRGDSLTVCESRTISSFPKDPVWQWPYEFPSGGINPTYVDDLDQDGKKDMYLSESNILFVYENLGDNLYQPAFRESIYNRGFAVDKISGDFDQDGRKDIAMGYSGWPSTVVVYECIGDDRYQIKWADSVRYANSYDVFSADDADGDGKPEFMVGWHSFGAGWTYNFRIYESTGDDRYEIIYFGNPVGGLPLSHNEAYSECGDVDADGRPEIVWAIGDDWYVYKATGNNQFQQVFEAYPRPRGNSHMTTKVYVCDMNGNGYPEIFETGELDTVVSAAETKIWEIEGVRLHRPNGGEVLTPGSQFPITWEKYTPPGADSFTLFVSFNDGVDYQTIGTIRQSDDTLYAWSVPDTLADSCKLMIWAYGPPRAGQNVPRGTAWDFSDSSFAIRQTGVGEDARSTIHDTRLEILQNPTTKARGVRLLAIGNGQEAELEVYDVSGKLVQSFLLGPMLSAPCPIALHLSAGVYFVRLEESGAAVTEKVVVVE